jgi:hypothetical protein
MNKIAILLALLLLFGCLGGVYLVKKYQAAQRRISKLDAELRRSAEAVEELTELLGSQCPNRMIFLHHSVGRTILYAGGLQRLLLERGIFASGATYGDEIGQHTDVLDWPPKFAKEMEKILTFKSHPDRYYTDGTRNRIVAFKSCYPNSNIVDGSAVGGDAASAARTLENYQAVFAALRPEMLKRADTLFIYLTAPPLVPEKTTPENAARARAFNDWLIGEFLPQYREVSDSDNFAVFDLFGFLAGPDNTLKEGYRVDQPADSHPNDEASRLAAEAFVEFLEPLWENWQAGEGGNPG